MTLDRGLKYILIAIVLGLVGVTKYRESLQARWSPLVCDPVDVNRDQYLVLINCERSGKYTDRISVR